MTKFALLLTCLVLLTGCWRIEQQPASQAQSNRNAAAEGRASAPQPEATPKGTDATVCHNIDVGEKAVLKSQTFPIDFEPFKGSCFVTSHDPEYTDPPLESEYAIYRDGKSVFTFPDQFNGVQVGCWVRAVAFQDVNADSRTDIVVVGKCNGKSDSFNENSIYLNDGRGFVTSVDSNYKLADYQILKDVTDFARKNPELFAVKADASDSNRKP